LITVPVLLAFWFVGHASSFENSYVLKNLLSYISFSLHFGDFIRGLIRSEAVAFYAIVSLIALVLNSAYLQWRR